MAKYGTQEWFDLYKEELNNSKAYEEAAKTWEGDFYFIMEKGGALKETLYAYVDLYHGKCRKAELVPDLKQYKPEFIISAPYAVWKRISTKQLDSTQALITKQSKLMTGSKGTIAKIMRYTKAANELTNCTCRVPTEWLD
ncbi:MAG: SCP2 sterol-binding domain-containing protein [Syntrophobacteraceae bacterium]|jgi:putative sterol carrier protein